MEATIAEKLDIHDCREIGSDAVITISTAKPGNGVEQLRDGNTETYWQSDGSFPHLINFQFLRKASVSKVCIYLDHNADESYTPKKIAVAAGSSFHDLTDVIVTELNEPVGWVILDLASKATADDPSTSYSSMLRTNLLQVKILAMHQNGRDTHVRQIKILGSRESPLVMADFRYDNFKTIEMKQYALLR